MLSFFLLKQLTLTCVLIKICDLNLWLSNATDNTNFFEWVVYGLLLSKTMSLQAHISSYFHWLTIFLTQLDYILFPTNF